MGAAFGEIVLYPYGQFPRSAGVILHPTSLPGPYGTGDLGPHAHRFVDWLAEAGMSVWQVLPLVPPGAGDSPYSTQSALSGSPWLIDLEALRHDGLLESSELWAPSFSLDTIDSGAMQAFKGPRLAMAADRLLEGRRPDLSEALEIFRHSEPWVEDAALFRVLKQSLKVAWWQWEPPLRDRHPQALARVRAAHRRDIDREVVLQFFFERQWRQLHDHCRAKGIRLLGDIPIYVDGDSVDVWSNRDQFLIDADGKADPLAGVPPDYFSEVGQFWGNPIYDWERMHDDGYRWWIARLRRALGQTDLVRLDHFRGFSAYWVVPAGSPDARPGHWVTGPGKEVFDALRDAFGDLPLVAEDLGDIDEEVHELRKALGLPGMKVLQFAFGAGPGAEFLPHNCEHHSIIYTGTHDNDTTLGWWLGADERVRDHVRRYLAIDGSNIVWDMIRTAFASVAHTALVPMQDALALGSDARMNKPGLGRQNWAWRVRAEAINPSVSSRLREQVELYGRLPCPPSKPKPSVVAAQVQAKG